MKASYSQGASLITKGDVAFVAIVVVGGAFFLFLAYQTDKFMKAGYKCK